MAQIVITGAAGSVGSVARSGLQDHDVTPVTHREHDNLDSIVLDVEDRVALMTAFEDQDIVVHLAGNPSPEAEWESVLSTNIGGTYNIYEAALANDVDRVVFASTNHIHQMYNIDQRSRPETVRENATAVRPDAPHRPDSYYAVSKVAGEALGNYYAMRHGLEVVNLRIGWLLTEEELLERQADDSAIARYARAMWLSPDDCRDGIRKAVETPLDRNPVSVNLVSANQERYLSITETQRQLGYAPVDNSATVVE
ncbi:NAD-dependent epimerase/dehydratase family protein [Haladaptatus salinisoli]|uniref:NAD-dependent epimerase/dehydratase family protein n=1 Tax=Haladaptatus salinisoli TaxID=2884876 RepID=UPI001D0B1376|nr:NAD(P)-dependent oxidoreductase [Haladaptatus salinisoli]